MIIKVCGITDIDQYHTLARAGVDMIGFNFYPKSKRYLAAPLPGLEFGGRTKNVGVFVNPDISEIEGKVKEYNLDYIQLHGDESIEFCEEVRKISKVIKVFGVDRDFTFNQTKNYDKYVDLFLLDTKTSLYGGSGRKFNWDILNEYQADTPFILSGGIAFDDLPEIKKIDHPKLIGIDINSRFELSPGIKDLVLINKLMLSIKNEES